MGKRLVLLVALAMVIGLTVPAFAAVQNIKVSGDIQVQAVGRDTMDLRKYTHANTIDDSISTILSTIGLRFDADLTDKVSAVVRLVSERNWDELASGSTDVGISLGYITLKEFLYSPLTLVLGRQGLKYGTGFIIGDPDTNQFSEFNHYSGIQADSVVPEDLSTNKSFDAVKAILNYDPLVIDLIWSKIDEGTILGSASAPENDDVNLYGANVAYNFGGDKNLTSDTYVFVKDVSSFGGTGGVSSNATVTNKIDRVITIGERATIMPSKRLYMSAEIAGQVGQKYFATGYRDRRAMAYQAFAQYALDMKYSPLLKACFSHYSGDKNPIGNNGGVRKSFKGWDPMFEDQAGGKIFNALFAPTNVNVVEARGSIVPLEDLTVSLEYAYLWLDKAFPPEFNSGLGVGIWLPNDYTSGYSVSGKKAVGSEIDVVLTYDYTEDVQIGLNTGVFLPGQVFNKSNRENAYQAIGSVKVTF